MIFIYITSGRCTDEGHAELITFSSPVAAYQYLSSIPTDPDIRIRVFQGEECDAEHFKTTGLLLARDSVR